MPEIVDDKSEHCMPFILERLKLHREQHQNRGDKPPPFFLGLNGVQGAGKTTLVGYPGTFLLYCIAFPLLLVPLPSIDTEQMSGLDLVQHTLVSTPQSSGGRPLYR